MKNCWLVKKNDVSIEQLNIDPNIAEHGKWYVSKTVGVKFKYLHRDGVWRDATVNENDEYTGYFDTKEEAEETYANEELLAG